MRRKTIASSSGDDHDQEDRLSLLPDVLLLYIFSFIDTKFAVQASLLSKRWVNLWTSIPVLNLNSIQFIDYRTLNSTFDKLIDNVLATRNRSIKLDSVNIQVTDYNTLARVLEYALSHRVSNLNIDTYCGKLTEYHPISFLNNSSDSLINLTMKGRLEFGAYPVFSNLVDLRLIRVKIVTTEPFSSFPNLKVLFLINSKLHCDLPVLEVIGSQLKRLTIYSCFYQKIPYPKIAISAPKLARLELDGLIPMEFETSEISDLDNVYIDCRFWIPRKTNRRHLYPNEVEQKVNLINILGCLKNAKCVHLPPSTVKLLTLSHSVLDEEPCPFVNLKVLNLVPQPNEPVSELHSSVATYLLKGSPGAVVKSFSWY